MARRPALGGGGPTTVRLGGQGRRGGGYPGRGGQSTNLQATCRAPTGYRARPQGEAAPWETSRGVSKARGKERAGANVDGIAHVDTDTPRKVLTWTLTPPGRCSRGH